MLPFSHKCILYYITDELTDWKLQIVHAFDPRIVNFSKDPPNQDEVIAMWRMLQRSQEKEIVVNCSFAFNTNVFRLCQSSILMSLDFSIFVFIFKFLETVIIYFNRS